MKFGNTPLSLVRDLLIGFNPRMVITWTVYVFLVMPTFIVIPMSFGGAGELEFPPQSWGVTLYESMLDPANGWIDAVGRSVLVAVLSTGFALVLGVPAAYGLARGKFLGKKALTFSMLSPIFAPTIVIGLALYLYFARLGLSGTLISLVVSHTVVIAPFIIITSLSGLKHLDPNIEAAAMVMGATPLQIFLKVVLPVIRAPILSGALFAFLLSFDEVVVSWFIARSDHPTLPVKMYSSIQWEVSPVLAAISTVLILITIVISLIASFLQPPDYPQK